MRLATKTSMNLIYAIKFTVIMIVACCRMSYATDLDKSEGKALYEKYCTTCHNGTLPESPNLSALSLYPPTRVLYSLESGIMSTQGMQLTAKEKLQVAYYITGKKPKANKQESQLTMCSSDIKSRLGKVSDPVWKGWGNGYSNQRYQADESVLTTENVSKLSIDWSFAFPDATRSRAQPLVSSELVFIGSQSGVVYALDIETSCVRWQFQSEAEVRGALHMHHDKNKQQKLLIFGDIQANVYAIDALTGALKWQKHVGYHAMNTITGSVTANESTVFVPMSSLEIIPAAKEDYECCTFRGSLIALDINTGNNLWTSYTTEPPQLVGKNSEGTLQFAPSGAPIWSSPTLDTKRNLIYVTTGQNYSSPSTGTSDAVIAIDIKNGEQKWVTQVTKGDAWNGACVRKRANCPEENGPDFDIGASAMLVSDKQNRDWLVIGQKSGMVYGLDPNQQGKIIWKRRVGSGGTMGGVHWGMSTDNQQIYVGVSDLPTNNHGSVGKPNPGVSALQLETGEISWHYTPPNICTGDEKYRCFNGISASVSSSPGLVYAGGLDGVLHILDAKSGHPLWSYNTNRTFPNSNGIKAFGGSIEADGPVIANGKMYITSGYDKWGEAPGNMLLVFSLDGNKHKGEGDK